MNQQLDLNKLLDILQLPEEKRNLDQIKLLAKYFNSIKFFQELKLKMGEQVLEQCVRKLKVMFLEKGKTLFKFGDEGDQFFIIIQGKVSVQVPKNVEEGQQYLNAAKRIQKLKRISIWNNKPYALLGLLALKTTKQKYESLPVIEFREASVLNDGNSFGEYALSQNAPRAATINCLEDC